MAINLFIFQFPGISNIYCAFQSRTEQFNRSIDSKKGNISFRVGDPAEDVINTRKELLKELQKLGLYGWHECAQVHGNNLEEALAPTALDACPAELTEADGMMTAKPGLGLMIKTADCQPVFVADKTGRYILALHVGWRGNRMDFPGDAILNFCKRYNLEAEQLVAVRGPSLGPNRSQFINFDREWGDQWEKWFNKETQCLNLWQITNWQLHNPHSNKAGIPYENIYGLDICTYSNCQKFFSYRKNKNTGRQANFIWIAKTAQLSGNFLDA